MAYRIKLLDSAEKDLDSIGRTEAQRILRFLFERVGALDDPRGTGKALKGKTFAGLWRYRVGDYRVICQIVDRELLILAVHIGHRREIYR